MTRGCLSKEGINAVPSTRSTGSGLIMVVKGHSCRVSDNDFRPRVNKVGLLDMIQNRPSERLTSRRERNKHMFLVVKTALDETTW